VYRPLRTIARNVSRIAPEVSADRYADVAVSRARRAPVPDDPALPRLGVVLDADAIAPFLHRSLGPEAPFPDVRVHYLRYKPGTSSSATTSASTEAGTPQSP
jgi:hypothetical protein